MDYILNQNITLKLKDEINYPVLNTNFHLAYHGLDNKDILIKSSNFYKKLYPELQYTAPNIRTELRTSKRRIGFISKFLMDHPVSRCYIDFIIEIAKSGDFEVYLFSTSTITAKESFANTINEFEYVQIPEIIDQARSIISSHNLDILIYLDIGMISYMYYLSFSRLAPVQCVLAGHPETTGVDTIDYFLSTKYMHLNNSQKHYSEKLIRFKNNPVYYKKHDFSENLITLEELGLPSDYNYYICPMAMQKIHPDFDIAIAEILRRDKKAKIGLFKLDNIPWHEKLIERFKVTIPDIWKRIIFFPYTHDRIAFHSLLKNSSAVLDSFHFGGGSTYFMAFSIGVPIVTLPGKFLRSRVGYGLYKQMGIMDLIAKDSEDYVELAIKLANDKNFHNMISSKIMKNNHTLYENIDSIKEISKFLKEVKPIREKS